MKLPAKLSAAERAAWDLHVGWVRRLKLESSVDAGQMLALVRMYCRAAAADAVVRRRGMSYRLLQGSFAQRPEVGISKECWKLYTALADKFGLSATSRAKLGAGKVEPERAGDVPPELRDADGGGA
jgi:P27 family predicted phage terminase small subunit